MRKIAKPYLKNAFVRSIVCKTTLYDACIIRKLKYICKKLEIHDYNRETNSLSMEDYHKES